MAQSHERRDHGGKLDEAIARFGGERADWIDLSTGINPVPYPIPAFERGDWTALPDAGMQQGLVDAARAFWNVPQSADILAAAGASVLIAQIPALCAPQRVRLYHPSYNEHAAAFALHGWQSSDDTPQAMVAVHPNNPDGKLWAEDEITAPLSVIDESFCDVIPNASLIHLAGRKGTIILKSFGKFWGLAGLRLGFAIGDPKLIGTLRERLGPWPVSGAALRIGTTALRDHQWADQTRQRLAAEVPALDSLMAHHGARNPRGTDLFRLYEVENASQMQERLARCHIWTRIFPYSNHLIRLGLPDEKGWNRLKAIK